MAGYTRPPPPVAPTRKTSAMRPPPPRPASRSTSGAVRPRAPSPAESVRSVSVGIKRKDRDFDHDGGEETNINVFVRCRGRNEREIRENSAVVLSTDGAKGKTVELSMGPNAMSNKTYHFDKVFAPAADQSMIYDDAVAPVLDEMIAGFNCTIFAYGQTGTGKTYTMSGDMKDQFGMLSENAGIIPRVLHGLFTKLELEDLESDVKCSFIELYNEELRDLIAADTGATLKIFDDNTKKGHATTIVQGMEESHIKSAIEGVKLLQKGSNRRQVAATNCNTDSSRSHTVFTVTAYIKRTNQNGEDYLSAGKLNLVDLAGSENIQRSGAENKRAAEAGLINKSLLTLGRVINALVDRNSHIPYRESKLTRLLQDSLGGRTKTCIIATVSPAKSNLEETISTLDYAFRAKNIRNKPQTNQMINKKTLLKEFTYEIEKLKSELIATRHRNGVYLANEDYEQIMVEKESRRILTDEQAARIEALETNLRNKVTELFSLTSNFMTMKKENETHVAALDQTKGLLEQTEFVLNNTKQCLAEETFLRKAHQQTEERLNNVGAQLISTLDRTVSDVGGLHSKIRRKSDLQSLNRNTWGLSQAQVVEVTSLVESRVEEFHAQQKDLMISVAERMQSFVEEELQKLSETQAFLDTNVESFENSEQEVSEQTLEAKEKMDNVLEEIKTLREEVKARVGEGLKGLGVAAERISAEVINELDAFHTQLHSSYSDLGKDFKQLFEDLVTHINSQKAEVTHLRQQLAAASEAVNQANVAATTRLDDVLEEEREQAASERQTLLSQIANLVNAQGEAQDARLSSKISGVKKDFTISNDTFSTALSTWGQGMDSLTENENTHLEAIRKSREGLKTKLKDDWASANKRTASIQTTTKSVHAETIRIVDEQMKDIATQMQALDDFVTRARSENASHHDTHTESLRGLTSTVKASYSNIGTHFTSSYERVKDLGEEMTNKTSDLQGALSPLHSNVAQPLQTLREDIASKTFKEYQITGETPQKVAYTYPHELPRTEPHELLLAAMRRPNSSGSAVSVSPSKAPVYIDSAMDIDIPLSASTLTSPVAAFSATVKGENPHAHPTPNIKAQTLREVDLNANASTSSISNIPTKTEKTWSQSTITSSVPLKEDGDRASTLPIPSLKRSLSGLKGRKSDGVVKNTGGLRKKSLGAAEKEKENEASGGGLAVPTGNGGFSQSVGPGVGEGRRRRSPRIMGST